MKNTNQQKRFIPKLKIKSGDTVKVIAGEDKGKEGRVLKVLAAKNRAIVEGVRIMSRHTKPNAENPNGGIIKKEAPIHISNLMGVAGGSPSRIGRKEEAGKLKRFSKKTGELID